MQIQGETFVNKLIVLFVFDKMESALSERTIVDMCSTSNDWINYMDCVMIISQLLEDGFICTVDVNDDTLYSITPDGRGCLANFYRSPSLSKTTVRATATGRSASLTTIRTKTAPTRYFCASLRPPSPCWS